MEIKIIREKSSPCCTGKMWVDGKEFGFTLERPWLNNKKQVSAIPAGKYKLEFTMSNRFKRELLQVMYVQDRGGIRIHSANKFIELEGCIAVGFERVGEGLNEILHTKVPLLEQLAREAISRGESLKLEIVNGWENVVA